MQRPNPTVSSAPQGAAPLSPLGVAAQEHWFPALLLAREAGSFKVSPGRFWPRLEGRGLPAGGLSVLSAIGVVVDNSRWWLRLCGLRTLMIESHRGEGTVSIPAFVGRTERVEDLKAEVLRRATVAFDNLGRQLASLLDSLETDRNALFLPAHYVRHSQLMRLLASHECLTSEDGRRDVNTWLTHPMHVPNSERMALDARIHDAYAFLDAAEEARKTHNNLFVATQAEQHADYFAGVESEELTDEQIEASLLFDDANVTVAAAGSGKTSVMVSKVGYALKSGLLKEHEIIVLAYNNAAARELRDRISSSLQKALDRSVKVEARTFHSLGFRLWRKQQTMLVLPNRPRLIDFEKADGDAEPDEDDGSGTLKGKRLLRTVLLELADDPIDRSFASAVMKWAGLYRYPTPELDACDEQELQERQARYESMCRKMSRRKGAKAFEPSIPTFDPQCWMRSTEGAMLFNWLYLRHIPFAYERRAPDWLTGKINAGLPDEEHVNYYKPNFTYPNPQDNTKSYFHEHFGLDRNGRAPSFLGKPYEDRARHKRKVLNQALKSRQAGVPSRFIETFSAQFADGTIFQQLEQALVQRGIPVASPDPMRWDAALKTFLQEDSVVNLIAGFLVKFRDSGLSMEDVEDRMQQMKATDRQRALSFLQWMKPLMARLDQHMERWTSNGKPRPLLDFAGMIDGAVRAVKAWPAGTLPFKLVLVDEFQDISRLRAQLVQGLLDQHPGESMLYCVGDDWQSINRFAGSDVGIFRQVYDGLRSPRTGSPMAARWSAQSMLKKTFRCPQGIADVARWFVMQNGTNTELIDKPVASNKVGKEGVVRVIEHADSSDDRWATLEAQMKRIAEQHAQSGKKEADVFILMRNKKDAALPDGINAWKVKRLAERYKAMGLNISRYSMHGSKGLGAEYVVLVGMDSGFKGYPSDRWDDPLIEALLPLRRSSVDEERRLFYVALTRAKVEVTILCAANRPSPFVHELEQYPEEGVIVFDKMPGVVRYLCPKCEQSWVKRQHRPGRVDCMRSPFCTFAAADGKYAKLPPARTFDR